MKVAPAARCARSSSVSIGSSARQSTSGYFGVLVYSPNHRTKASRAASRPCTSRTRRGSRARNRTSGSNEATIASKWLQEPNEGTIGQVNGLLTLSSQVGDDARWTAAVAKPVRLRASVAEGAEVEIIAGIKPALVDDGASCGVYVHNAATGAAQLFGILRSGGGNRWWYRTIDVDGESGAPTMGEVVGGLVPAGTVYWLRLKRRTDEEGEFDLQYRVDGSGFDGPWTTLASGLETIASPLHWCGPFVAVDTAPAVNGNAASFVDFRIVTPQSRHVWQWFVYRDPSLAPAYDRAGAQLVLDKMKPAHTRGTVIESLAFVVGSPFSRVGVEPVGVV